MTRGVASPSDRQLSLEDPWPGLDAFDESAQRFFHGREAEVDELSRHVAEAPVTVLFGKSGLGKTSLLKAGLFPRLRARQLLPVYIRLAIREDAPPLIDQVRETLVSTLEREHIEAPSLATDETLWQYLHRIDLELWDSRNYPVVPVLVFDQFEETFTLGALIGDIVQRFKEDFGDFVENRIPASLSESLDRGHRDAGGLALRTMAYKVVVSLREDFLPELESWRHSIPSLGRRRVRLLPMRYEQAMSAVLDTAPHLMDKTIADRIVRFVAAEQLTSQAEGSVEHEGLADQRTWAVEPALLSLFCRGLNERRKQQRKSQFDEGLLEESKQGIISDYYRSCVEGMPESVGQFIENELITEKGFRNSYAKEDAVPAHLLEEQLDQLITRRLLRVEERYGTQRIELTHDVLTRAVREHRDYRRAERESAKMAIHAEEERRALTEAARKREVELEEQRRVEREQRLESEAEAGRRFRKLAVGLAIALLAAMGMSAFALVKRSEAAAAAESARTARAMEATQRAVAERLLTRVTNGIRMKQAVLSGDRDRTRAYLASDLANKTIRFTASSDDLGYRTSIGQRVYKFLLYPVESSLPRGKSAVAVITYRMDHPTFQNGLLATGPNHSFAASYTGWGCLRQVTALIEYADPQHAPEIAEYDMCAALGW